MKKKRRFNPFNPVYGFVGYQETSNNIVLSLLINLLGLLPAGERGWAITEQSPFFVECGGQVSDKGTIVIADEQTPLGALKKLTKRSLLKSQRLN